MTDIDEQLTPSYHGEQCRHNGNDLEFEIACDNCNYFNWCFPEGNQFFEFPERYLNPKIYQLKTSSDEEIKAFLQAELKKKMTKEEQEIHILVLDELVNRWWK